MVLGRHCWAVMGIVRSAEDKPAGSCLTPEMLSKADS